MLRAWREHHPDDLPASLYATLSVWVDLAQDAIRCRMEQEPPPTEDELMRIVNATTEALNTNWGQLAIIAREKMEEADDET